MNRILLLCLAVVLFYGCSNDEGKVVEKSASETPSTSVSSSMSPLPQMPAGHPPVQGMPGMTGQTVLSPGPAPEPVLSGTTAHVASLIFDVDPAWKMEQPQSAMRAGQFRLPAPEGAEGDGELGIFQGIGGSADANIQRWIGQFKQQDGEPQIEKMTVGSFQVQVLDVTGTYGASMGPMMSGGSDQPGYRMLAAVIEGGTNGPWHFKLVGPKKTLDHWKPAFLAMIHSLKPENS